MKTTIQTGIDASKFQTLMYQLAQAGAEADAHEAHRKHLQRLKLLGKQCERNAQGELFGGEENA